MRPEPASVRDARRFVGERLPELGFDDATFVAELLVSELVTNAVLHARTGIRVVLHTDGAALRVSVFDENPRVPVYEACPAEATSGRGLSLVEGLAGAWGVDRLQDGKVVWFELAGSRARGPDIDLSAGGSRHRP